MGTSRACVLVCLAALANAQPNQTKCQTGAADILGARKAVAVQVCNLFGSTCVINHPAIASANCATEALSIANGECKLYPIFEYADNAVRGSSGVERMSTVSNFGCSITSSSSNGVRTYKISGACVSVQCSLGGTPATFAGPGFSGTGSSRTAVTNTATATFSANTYASLPQDADQLKNVFLVRTGNYVGTSSMSTTSSNSISYSVGKLPTSDGNNYGPKACPSSNKAMDSATATGITKEDLRMCGSTGKWVYYNALNFVMDKELYAKYSGNNAGNAAQNAAFAAAGTPNVAAGTAINIKKVPFLTGKSAYRSSLAMDDPRKVYIHNGNTASSALLMTSDTISPKAGTRAPFATETGGAWRNFGVAFYCDDYARTDLTQCAEANRKMFYVCDPNPNACFGSAQAIGSNAALSGQACTANADCCSNSCTDSTCAAGCGSSVVAGGGDGVSNTVVSSTTVGSSGNSSGTKVVATASAAVSTSGQVGCIVLMVASLLFTR